MRTKNKIKPSSKRSNKYNKPKEGRRPWISSTTRTSRTKKRTRGQAGRNIYKPAMKTKTTKGI